MDDLEALGLGLDYGSVRLVPTRGVWVRTGAILRDQTADLLGAEAEGVEHIGSSSVTGLLAKPIIDLAVGVGRDRGVDGVRAPLESAGWIYRGDAGGHGGQVFVLESRPWHRVAHLHVVEHGGAQWTAYLRFRDLLRDDAAARTAYEAEKQRLAREHPHDHRAYTAGKSSIVSTLLTENLPRKIPDRGRPGRPAS